MNKTYDAVVVLASQPKDPSNWKFPSHVYKSLDRAAELLLEKAAPYIVVSGKWAIRFDIINITQPFKECDTMADYLITKGVKPELILKEADSQDTISNLYYMKKQIFKPKSMKKLLFIAAEFRLNRIKFLCDRILGPDYDVDLEGVEALPEEIYPHEAHTLQVQSEFLAPMKNGDDAWLDDKFFTDPYYENLKKRLLARPPEERFFS